MKQDVIKHMKHEEASQEKRRSHRKHDPLGEIKKENILARKI